MTGAVVFSREGDWLIGRLEYTRADGSRQTFEGRANLRAILSELVPLFCRGCGREITAAAGGDPAAVGFFGKLVRKIGKVAKKLGKGKVFRSIGKAIRKGAKVLRAPLKLPGLRQAVTLAAAAYPPLGVPAMAAFQGANLALAAAEKGPRQAAQLAGTLRQLSRVARLPGKAGQKARKALKVLRITNRWRKGLHAAQQQATRQAVAGLELPPVEIPIPPHCHC